MVCWFLLYNKVKGLMFFTDICFSFQLYHISLKASTNPVSWLMHSSRNILIDT